MKDFYLSLLGLMITFIISMGGIITSGKSYRLRLTLGIFTTLGLGVAVYFILRQNDTKSIEHDNKIKAERKTDSIAVQLNKANSELKFMKDMLVFVQFTVGDLARLNEIGGDSKYYVQIAADPIKKNLLQSLSNINNTYRGAEKSGLVVIREPRHGSKKYILVFGQGLDMVAAEVFFRLAKEHNFSTGSPMIKPELDNGVPTSK